MFNKEFQTYKELQKFMEESNLKKLYGVGGVEMEKCKGVNETFYAIADKIIEAKIGDVLSVNVKDKHYVDVLQINNTDEFTTDGKQSEDWVDLLEKYPVLNMYEDIYDATNHCLDCDRGESILMGIDSWFNTHKEATAYISGIYKGLSQAIPYI